jgi:hypothetical protein
MRRNLSLLPVLQETFLRFANPQLQSAALRLL